MLLPAFSLCNLICWLVAKKISTGSKTNLCRTTSLIGHGLPLGGRVSWHFCGDNTSGLSHNSFQKIQMEVLRTHSEILLRQNHSAHPIHAAWVEWEDAINSKLLGLDMQHLGRDAAVSGFNGGCWRNRLLTAIKVSTIIPFYRLELLSKVFTKVLKTKFSLVRTSKCLLFCYVCSNAEQGSVWLRQSGAQKQLDSEVPRVVPHWHLNTFTFFSVYSDRYFDFSLFVFHC